MRFSTAPSQRLAWFLVLWVCGYVFYQDQIRYPQIQEGRNDLKHLYLGSRLLARGLDPYSFESLNAEAGVVRHPDMRTLNPYVYPPFTGYLFSFWSRLDYDAAKTTWFWGCQACLLLSLVLMWPTLTPFHPLARAGVLLASVSFFFPLFRATSAGQLVHFLLSLLCATMALWRVGAKKSAGAVLGVATLVKVQPAFLVVWLAWKREWAALATALGVIAALVLIPSMRFGLEPYFDYLRVVGQMGYGSSTWSETAAFYVDAGNVGFPAFLYRAFTDNPRTEHWIDLGRGFVYALCVCWAFLILAGCLWCCRIGRKDEDPEMELGAWMLGMLLIPSLFWDHYLVLALPAWFVLLSRVTEKSAGNAGDALLGVLFLCWVCMGWWISWFDPSLLSGARMLWLNLPLPAVLILFAISVWIAKTGHHNRQALGYE